MKDTYLIERLRSNAPQILEVLKNAGVDVSLYESLAAEMAQKSEERKKRAKTPITPERAEINRQNRIKRAERQKAIAESERTYKSAIFTAKVSAMAEDGLSFIGQAQTLAKHIKELEEAEAARKAEEHENNVKTAVTALNRLKQLLDGFATNIIEQEQKEEKTAQNVYFAVKTLKGLLGMVSKDNPNVLKDERIKETKASFIKFYCENWFLLLLGLIDSEDLLFCKKRASTRACYRRKV